MVVLINFNCPFRGVIESQNKVRTHEDSVINRCSFSLPLHLIPKAFLYVSPFHNCTKKTAHKQSQKKNYWNDKVMKRKSTQRDIPVGLVWCLHTTTKIFNLIEMSFESYLNLIKKHKKIQWKWERNKKRRI